MCSRRRVSPVLAGFYCNLDTPRKRDYSQLKHCLDQVCMMERGCLDCQILKDQAHCGWHHCQVGGLGMYTKATSVARDQASKQHPLWFLLQVPALSSHPNFFQ